MRRTLITASGFLALVHFGQLTTACDGEETGQGSQSTIASSASSGGAGGQGGAPGGGGNTSTSSSGGSGGGVEAASGVVVVAGKNQGVDVLYVLDRDSGNTLANDTQKTAAIIYDGRADSWLMFDTVDFPVPPGTKGRLLAKRFSLEFNLWQQLETLDPVELPRNPRDLVVFGQALLYLAERNTPPGTNLVGLRVGDPTQIESFFPDAIDVTTSLASDTILGLTGSSGGAIKGGTAHLIIERDLGNDACQLMLQRYTVGDGTTTPAGSMLPVGTSYDCAGKPTWAADHKSNTLLFAIPPAAGQNDGSLLRLQPKTLAVDQQIPLSFTGSPTPRTLGNMTLDPCNQIALITSTDGASSHGVWASPLDELGQAAWLTTAKPPNQVSYDQGHHRVLVANGEDTGFGIDAHLLKGNCLAPNFGVVTPAQWAAPIFLAPHTTLAPQALPLRCAPSCNL